jgi:hypothetical protein
MTADKPLEKTLGANFFRLDATRNFCRPKLMRKNVLLQPALAFAVFTDQDKVCAEVRGHAQQKWKAKRQQKRGAEVQHGQKVGGAGPKKNRRKPIAAVVRSKAETTHGRTGIPCLEGCASARQAGYFTTGFQRNVIASLFH